MRVKLNFVDIVDGDSSVVILGTSKMLMLHADNWDTMSKVRNYIHVHKVLSMRLAV